MRHNITLLSILLMGCCLFGCEKGVSDTDDNGNAVVVTPAAATKADSGTLTKNGDFVYSIGSVFVGGGIADPSEGSSHRCHFYKEKFTEGPNWDEVEALVEIYGFRYNGVDYQESWQCIDEIIINGLDESLGFGPRLHIPMNQGEYQGGSELIKDVKIKSYRFASYIDYQGHQNKDADINIVITSTAGDIITIRFANDVTPYDGYY